jgi:rubrerythrin
MTGADAPRVALECPSWKGVHMATPLTEKQERLLVLFKQAIERERDAQQLYSEMLSHCEDQELKPIIESLRAEERRHEDMLVITYKALRKTDAYQGPEMA